MHAICYVTIYLVTTGEHEDLRYVARSPRMFRGSTIVRTRNRKQADVACKGLLVSLLCIICGIASRTTAGGPLDRLPLSRPNVTLARECTRER